MQREPWSNRPHIVLVGRRNVGKSSLMNALTNQPMSLVSDVPGTTTDPVKKAFELLPFGPVVFVDTGGLDDVGELGLMRVHRARREMAAADLVLHVVEAGEWSAADEELHSRFASGPTPYILVVNKIDRAPGWRAPVAEARYVSATAGEGVAVLKGELSNRLRTVTAVQPTILGDLVKGGDLVVLVVPLDLEAPKGRLILPQVMALRDVLDHDAAGLVVKERELYATLARLGRKPDLVICDSQVVLKVSADVPPDVRLTTFSILFARLKGDLAGFVKGARAIETLRDGDRVLIAEACSHHPIADDIGRVKIPRWIRQYTGREIVFESIQGTDWPADLERYKLVVHCGGCMATAKVIRLRQAEAAEKGVPVTNYGVAISYVHGVLPRVVAPLGIVE
ncbi:MAG: [FeFe] hydrogenase H-cluster maturation GTPase HydF [Myxococcales bacterium]|nr:MAG: [FeFe] hydrogenase H-cluster maturation GTPase HydF [Myxococcales bacterium]